jgi:hypothetical protein
MSRYDEFRELFAKESPRTKLAILRSESKRILSTIHGFGMLIQKLVHEREAFQMPPDFGEWSKKVVDGTEELMDLIGALTDSKHRDILRKEWEEQEHARAEGFWKEERAEFRELRNYASFVEAVKQTASKLGLSIPEDVKTTSFFYPSVMSAFSVAERRVNVQAVLPKHNVRPLGYAVTLSELAEDEINIKGRGHEGSTKSLDEVVLVLYRWLVEKWTLERIQDRHDWMKSGVILWR